MAMIKNVDRRSVTENLMNASGRNAPLPGLMMAESNRNAPLPSMMGNYKKKTTSHRDMSKTKRKWYK